MAVPLSRNMRDNLADEYDFVNAIPNIWSDQTWIPQDLLETAALAQHHGIPTRLLDWTYDLYIALHFGFRDAIGKEGNLVIWALNKDHLSFLKLTANRVNVEFITPHYANNPNLHAQQGLFTHWPIAVESAKRMGESVLSEGRVKLVDRRPLDELIGERLGNEPEVNIFIRVVLPCSEAIRGCHILDRLGYNIARLFPGYGGVAKQILSSPQLRAPTTSDAGMTE